MTAGTGTKADPWILKTPPLSSEYQMYVDEKDDKKVIICVVGKTTLLYDHQAIDDLRAMLTTHSDSMELGSADEQKPAKADTVIAWRPLDEQPAWRRYGLKKGTAWEIRYVHAATSRSPRTG